MRTARATSIRATRLDASCAETAGGTPSAPRSPARRQPASRAPKNPHRRRAPQRLLRSSSSASLAVIGPVTGWRGRNWSALFGRVTSPAAASCSMRPLTTGDNSATGSPSCVISIDSPARTSRIVFVSVSRSSRIPIRRMWPHVTTQDYNWARMIQAPPRSPTFSKPWRWYSASAGLSGSTLRRPPRSRLLLPARAAT